MTTARIRRYTAASRAVKFKAMQLRKLYKKKKKKRRRNKVGGRVIQHQIFLSWGIFKGQGSPALSSGKAGKQLKFVCVCVLI